MGSLATTQDALFEGRVRFVQPARERGYRVNVDAVLLARFAARQAPANRAFDLGSGVGAVGLSLLHLRGARHVTMVEIDEELAALAAESAALNDWSERVEVLHADVREAARDAVGRADLVVANPPYVPPGRGRLPKAAGRARARSGDLAVFLDAARAIAGRRARVAFIYPASEAITLLGGLRARGLEPKRLRAVHAREDAPARVVLVEAVAGKPGGLVVDPPLIESRGRD